MKNKIHTISRKAIIHGIASCLECDWEEADYNTVQKAARKHVRQTGHRVSGELSYHMLVGPRKK